MSQRMPAFVVELQRLTFTLANTLGVPRAQTVRQDGLYLGLRSKRDPGSPNHRKMRYITVRLRRRGVEVFREDTTDWKTFPSDHLITQLMLVK